MTHTPILLSDRFVEGDLRSVRKPCGSQKAVGLRAGVSASTVSRAERGFEVNFTSAILLGIALGLLDYGVYDMRDWRIRKVLRYMRIVERGGHAKGWNDYYGGVQQLIQRAA